MRRDRRPTRHAAPALALLVLAAALAGCTDGEAGPGLDAIGVLEAVKIATPEAKALAPSASLVAFVGHEGPAPSHLRGLAGDHLVRIDTSHDLDRGDGRAHAWAILFATHDGGLIRSTVVTSPYTTDTEWVHNGGDTQLQGLWALNMGGRLVVDTPQAVAALRDADAAIHRYLREAAQPNVVYASEIGPTDVGDTLDMAHRIDLGYTDWRSDQYDYYGLVSHFSGRVLASGDYERGEQARVVTIVDEEFTLNLVQRAAEATRVLPTMVYDTHLELDISGNGRYTFELWKDNETRIASYVGSAIGEPRHHEKDLGNLAPAAYTMRAEAVGQVTFHVVADGAVIA